MILAQKNNILKVVANPLARCDAAKTSISAGDYEKACEDMGELWQGVGRCPDLKGLGDETASVVLLRVGALTSILGEQEGDTSAQSKARHLIGMGRALASGPYGRLEADSEIGATYIRAKDYYVAALHLSAVQRELGSEPSELLAATICRLATAYIGTCDLNKAISLLISSELTFEYGAAIHQRGKYHQLLATAYKDRGDIVGDVSDFDKALIEYEAACFYLEKCGNKTHFAITENNRGDLFLKLGMPDKAVKHFVIARRVFDELNLIEYVKEVDKELMSLKHGKSIPDPPDTPSPASNALNNVIPFRPVRMKGDSPIITVPDNGLIDLGYQAGDRLELRPAAKFSNGDVVLVNTIDGELLGRAYHEPKDGIRLQWAYDLIPHRTYKKGEYIVIAVL